MTHTVADYRSCAQSLVNDRITPQWGSYLALQYNFWRIANAFTTLIDFFAITQQDGHDFGQSTHDAFQKKNSTGWWYDDYSWWGVAFLRAAQYSKYVGYDEATWRGLAQTCWNEMAPATTVWDRADQQYFREAMPRFTGGCWNHDLVPGGVTNACDPLRPMEEWPVCGIQNTVTNMQYLVFAARFSQAEDAIREYGWLSKWFFDPSLSADQKLLASYDGVGMLVRERVSTYAQAADGTYPAVPNYVKDRHWTGDQGILLGALLEMARLDPGGQPEYYAVARAVLDAVRTKLVNDPLQKILQPWKPEGTIGSQYLTDYWTGVGVYMRYLLYAFLYDSELHSYIMETYRPFIQNNADEVCNSLGKCPPSIDPSIDQRECLLNQLAVLTAAIVILSP